jgi:arabinosaccharide transport system substrate-binding protein
MTGLLVLACADIDEDDVVGDDDIDAPDAAEDDEVEVIEMEVDPEHEGEEIELEYWSFIDTHVEFLTRRAEEFNEMNDDYNIILNASVVSFDEMHDRTLVALQAGTGAPDIVGLENQRFPTFMRGDIGLLPLTDAVEPYRDVVVEERLAPYARDGEQYGIDFQFAAFVMYYNDEIMTEAGVDIDEIVTWDDYIEAGQQVVAETDAYMTSVSSQDRLHLSALMLQNGGGLYNADGELIMDAPENAEAVDMARAMVHDHEIAAVTPGGSATDPVFFEEMNAGNFASLWMPMWYITRFNDFMPDLDGKMKIRPLPLFEEGGHTGTMGGGTAITITGQIDEAKVQPTKDFLTYAMLEYDSQVKSWTEMGWDPQRADVYEDPALQEPVPYFSDEPVMQILLEGGMLDNLAPDLSGYWYAEAVSNLEEIVAYQVIEEGSDPEAPLQEAAENIRQLEEVEGG